MSSSAPGLAVPHSSPPPGLALPPPGLKRLLLSARAYGAVCALLLLGAHGGWLPTRGVVFVAAYCVFGHLGFYALLRSGLAIACACIPACRGTAAKAAGRDRWISAGSSPCGFGR